MELNYTAISRKIQNESVSKAFKKLYHPLIHVRLEGLNSLNVARIEQRLGGHGITEKDDQLIKEELLKILRVPLKSSDDDIDGVWISAILDILVNWSEVNKFDVIELLNEVTNLTVLYLNTEKKKADETLLDIYFNGLKKGLNSFLKKVTKTTSSIQPSNSLFPLEWERNHPIVKIVQIFQNEVNVLLELVERFKDLLEIECDDVEMGTLMTLYLDVHKPVLKMIMKKVELGFIAEALLPCFLTFGNDNDDYITFIAYDVLLRLQKVPLKYLHHRIKILTYLDKFIWENITFFRKNNQVNQLLEWIGLSYLSLLMNSRESPKLYTKLNYTFLLRETLDFFYRSWAYQDKELNFIIWGYLLLTTTSTLEVSLILELLKWILENSKIDFILFGYYPIMKVYYQFKDLKIKEKCSLILEDFYKNNNESAFHLTPLIEKVLELSNGMEIKLKSKIKYFYLDGKLIDLFYYCIYCLPLKKKYKFNWLKYHPKDLLFTYFLCFKVIVHQKHYEDMIYWLDELINQIDLKLEALDILTLLLNILKAYDQKDNLLKENNLKDSIILNLLPNLILTKDELILTRSLKLLQTYNPLNSNSSSQELYLFPLGIKALYNFYLRNSRAWIPLTQTLKKYIEYHKQRHLRTSTLTIFDHELEATFFEIMEVLVVQKPLEMGDVFYKPLIELWNFGKLNALSKASLLKCINEMCVDEGLIKSKVYEDVFYKLIKKNTPPSGDIIIYREVTSFLIKLINDWEDSEEFQIIVDFLLNDHLLPILLPEEDRIIINEDMYSYALEAFAEFPVEIIQLCLGESPLPLFKRIIGNGKNHFGWIKVLHKLISSELVTLNASTYKGTRQIRDKEKDSLAISTDSIRLLPSILSLKTLKHPGLVGYRLILEQIPQVSNQPSSHFRNLMSDLSSEEILGELNWNALIHFFTYWAENEWSLITSVSEAPIQKVWEALIEGVNASGIIQLNSVLSLAAFPIALKANNKKELADAFGSQCFILIMDKLEAFINGEVFWNNELKFAILFGLKKLLEVQLDLKLDLIERIQSGLIRFDTLVKEKDNIKVELKATLVHLYHYLILGVVDGKMKFEDIKLILKEVETNIFNESLIMEITDLDEHQIPVPYFKSWISDIQLLGLQFALSDLYPRMPFNKIKNINLKLVLETLLEQLKKQVKPLSTTHVGIEIDFDTKSSQVLHYVLNGIIHILPYFDMILKDSKEIGKIDEIVLDALDCFIKNNNMFTKLENVAYINYFKGVYLILRCKLSNHPTLQTLMNKEIQLMLHSLETGSGFELVSALYLLSGFQGCYYYGWDGLEALFWKSLESNWLKIQKLLIKLLEKEDGLRVHKLTLVTLIRGLNLMYNNQQNINIIKNVDNKSLLIYLIHQHYPDLKLMITNLKNQSNEPKDYSRFNSDSYLRELYVQLIYTQQNKLLNISVLFIKSLRYLETPLPPLDWTSILKNLYRYDLEEKDRIELIHFGLEYMWTSPSLMFFIFDLVENLSLLNAEHYSLSIVKLLLGQEVIGNLINMAFQQDYPQKYYGSFKNLLPKAHIELKRFKETLYKLLAYLTKGMGLYPNSDTALYTLLTSLNLRQKKLKSTPEVELLRDELSHIAWELLLDSEFVEMLDTCTKNTDKADEILYALGVLYKPKLHHIQHKLAHLPNLRLKSMVVRAYINLSTLDHQNSLDITGVIIELAFKEFNSPKWHNNISICFDFMIKENKIDKESARLTLLQRILNSLIQQLDTLNFKPGYTLDIIQSYYQLCYLAVQPQLTLHHFPTNFQWYWTRYLTLKLDNKNVNSIKLKEGLPRRFSKLKTLLLEIKSKELNSENIKALETWLAWCEEWIVIYSN